MTGLAPGLALAAAAEALVGSQFRLHGRDPESGLDCVGVLAAALEGCGRGRELPADYSMHLRDTSRFTGAAGDFGLRPVSGAALDGDVLMFRVGPCQWHFGISCGGDAMVHAHAGLRRVVRSAAAPDWVLAGHWRLADAT